MKKTLILTSVLLLTACGGGGSGGGSDPRAAVIASNAKITAMLTEIGQDADGNQINSNLTRAASGSFIKNGTHYDSYKLNDVKIQIGDWEEARFVINDKGEITGLKIINPGGTNAPNGEFDRVGNNEFKVLFGWNPSECVNDDCSSVMAYTSYAKELGLKYADFGVITGTNPNINSNVTVSLPFAGGYDVKRLDASEFGTGGITFKGTAAAYIANHYDGHDNDQIMRQDKNATLVFENGTETLSANFADWYNVNIVKNAQDKITMVLDDTGKTIDDQYKFKNTPSANITSCWEGECNQNGEQSGWRSNYYGDQKNNNPEEATAMFQYLQDYTTGCSGDDCNVSVTIGFGGTKQP